MQRVLEMSKQSYKQEINQPISTVVQGVAINDEDAEMQKVLAMSI